MLRAIVAPNASSMTLDGTRTYLIGRSPVLVIDPGPNDQAHLDAVADSVGNGVSVSIVLTHGHPDHAAGADLLADRLGVRLTQCMDGDRLKTDAGIITAIATPGHTPDHFSFHWKQEEAVFCGDLMMGGLDTALVASPEGNLKQYMDSLNRLRALNARIIYPAHGPPIGDPRDAIDRYIRHRQERLMQVRAALARRPRTREDLIDTVYGHNLDPALRAYAADALQAYVDYLGEPE